MMNRSERYGDILQPLPEKRIPKSKLRILQKTVRTAVSKQQTHLKRIITASQPQASFDTDELVFSVPYMKNAFTATVNGEPVNVEEVDCGLMAIPVPAGEANIVVTYHTPGLKASNTISIAGIIIWILYALYAIIGQKKGYALNYRKPSTEVVEVIRKGATSCQGSNHQVLKEAQSSSTSKTGMRLPNTERAR